MCFGGFSPMDMSGEIARDIDFTPQSSSSTFDFGKLGLLTEGFGEVFKAFGAYKSEDARSKSYKYSADVARTNAEMERWRAREAARKGEQTMFTLGLKKGALMGSQRASMAARGLDLGEGSPLDLLASTEFMYQHDRATAKTNTENEMWAHRVQANNYENEARFYDEASEGSSPLGAAAGTLLGGATKVASSWYKLSQVS